MVKAFNTPSKQHTGKKSLQEEKEVIYVKKLRRGKQTSGYQVRGVKWA